MSRLTGRSISGGSHLAQSITDILSTPKGSRVLRRDYGSRLPDLIDAPMNGETMVDLFAETAEALDQWEPRLKLRRVEVSAARQGELRMVLTCDVQGVNTAVQVELMA
ncbi:GPW/gp25 family protein [Gemmobacter serpentinus]|uniref:GPW/gp25 family protein n=1 Tax=Gemmobacter serpentinus TaxID=2652247 RepID=UPI001CF7026D|nr:GPW/gp25 family protein [Gemmobacter serpentinus]